MPPSASRRHLRRPARPCRYAGIADAQCCGTAQPMRASASACPLGVGRRVHRSELSTASRRPSRSCPRAARPPSGTGVGAAWLPYQSRAPGRSGFPPARSAATSRSTWRQHLLRSSHLLLARSASRALPCHRRDTPRGRSLACRHRRQAARTPRRLSISRARTGNRGAAARTTGYRLPAQTSGLSIGGLRTVAEPARNNWAGRPPCRVVVPPEGTRNPGVPVTLRWKFLGSRTTPHTAS